MTVSRALKDHPHQSQETKKRIREIAEKLGYHPHPYITALMSQRARAMDYKSLIALAVFYFGPEQSARRHPYFKGIANQCLALGYKPELFHYNPSKISPERLRKILLTRGIRGIILMPALRSFESLDFDFDGFACIAMGHTITKPQLPRVGSDIQAGVFMALDKLVAKGYRRIALINTDSINQMSRHLYVANLTAYKRSTSTRLYLTDLVIPKNRPLGDRRALIKDWLKEKKPDAVISSDFDYNIYDELVAIGISIPQDKAYVQLLSSPNSSLSQVAQLEELMGAKAVNQVTAAINRNDLTTSQAPYLIGVAPEWREGDTTPNRVRL